MNYLCIIGTILIAVCLGYKAYIGVEWVRCVLAVTISVVGVIVWGYGSIYLFIGCGWIK